MSKRSQRYVLGIDVGTSGTKVLLLSSDGNVVGTAEAPHTLHQPRPGWSEQDPGQWWRATDKAVRRVLSAHPKATRHLSGIALSGQMHGSIFLNAKHKVLRPAILWNDQRTLPQCHEITDRAGGRKKLIRYTNNIALPGYTAPKILWVRQHEPRLFEQTRTVLLPKDYLLYRLTGERVTDVGDASGTLLFNVRKRRWHKKLLAALDLDPALFPKAVESTTLVGELHPGLRRQWGLAARAVPVAAGSGDQPTAAIGMGVLREGQASLTVGTSGVVFAATSSPVLNRKGLLQSFCHALPDIWCVFGCMLSAGASIEWLRENIFEGENTENLLKWAQEAGPGSDGLFFLPYLNGERCPYPDPDSRACWVGLHSRHTRSALVRAALEGVSFGLRDQLRAFAEEGLRIKELVCAGGGTRNLFWQQLQTDVLGVNTRRLETPHASALGAALIAGTTSGWWPNLSAACRKSVHAGRAHRPRHRDLYQKAYGVYRNLYPALQPAFQQIQGITGA